MNVGTLKLCLHWQEYVARETKDPVQRERCEKAAARLREMIEKEQENEATQAIA